MSVKVKKLRGSWYIVIDHKGQRKTKKVGGTLESARKIARQVEERLVRGELGIPQEDATSPLFSVYAERWLRGHGHSSEPGTKRSYETVVETYVTPRFGQKPLNKISRDAVKDFACEISEKGDHSRNTVRLILTALRAGLSAAVEDKPIDNKTGFEGWEVQQAGARRE